MIRNRLPGLVLCAILAGCASLSVGPDATLKQRIAAARTDMATASLFVSVYAGFPTCGQGIPQPCSNPNVIDLLEKGRIAALAALDAVDALVAAGSPQERIIIALQEAEKAIRLLTTMRTNSSADAALKAAREM